MKKTHPHIAKRLENVTLHEVMTHHAGLRDYMGDYVKAIKSGEKPNIAAVSDFLQYAEDSVSDDYGRDKPSSYSNLGSLFVGLALEQAYEHYRQNHPDENLPSLDFYGLLEKYIAQPAEMEFLDKAAPEGARVNLSQDIQEPTPEAPLLVASPAGGLWTSAEDLRKFGEWLYQESRSEPFMEYLKKYGCEFYTSSSNTIEHKGENPSASAMLSVSLNTGAIIATLSNSSRTDAHTLESKIRHNIFSVKIDTLEKAAGKEERARGSTAESFQRLSAKAKKYGKRKTSHITQRVTGINEPEIEKIMDAGEIQSVSIASGKLRKDIEDDIAITPIPNKKNESANQVYGAASLTKPVFTYLVLKLVDSRDDFKLDTKLSDILSFEDFCKAQDPPYIWNNSQENIARVEQFSPAMILSHQTGLPIGYLGKQIEFDFEPGKGFGYSGFSLMYLQACIEKKFELTLQELTEKYVFGPAKMSDSSFVELGAANAANSLSTTAEDYVKFCLHWMQDPDPRVQDAFQSKVSLRDDQGKLPGVKPEEISPEILNHLSWGYGWGLEKDKNGNVTAFHTGDMGPWRAGVQLNLTDKSVKVFFSKSTYENGHLLQEQVFGRSYALDYFFDKYKFARRPSELREDWRENPSYGLRKESIKNLELKSSTTRRSAPKEEAKRELPNPFTIKPKPPGT